MTAHRGGLAAKRTACGASENVEAQRTNQERTAGDLRIAVDEAADEMWREGASAGKAGTRQRAGRAGTPRGRRGRGGAERRPRSGRAGEGRGRMGGRGAGQWGRSGARGAAE